MNLKTQIAGITALIICSINSINAQSDVQILLAESRYNDVIQKLSPKANSLSATDNYYLAIAYQQTGYPHKAIDCLLKDSTNLSTQQLDLLSRSYMSNGNYSKALPICKNRYNAEPNNVINLLRYAEINHFYKDFDANINLLGNFTKHDSTNLSVNTLLAETYEKAKVPNSAISIYKMILSQYPDNQKIAVRLANLYLRQKMYVECHDLCVPYIEKLENNKNFLLIAGLANFKNGSNHNVLVMFRRLEAQGDSSFLTKKHLGIASYRLENYDNATKYLKSAFKLKDDDPEVAFFLGASLGQSNQPQNGIMYLYLAMELIKPSPVLMEKTNVKLAMIYFDMGNYKQAINNYHEAFKYDNKPQYLYRQASIYDYQLKDPKKAKEMYQLFIDVLPEELNPKKGNERYAIKLKEVAENRLTTLTEEDFFKNGI
ncbi:tetratricopeptide repeat protein [Carboxylicivirga sp. A043]|uniref:tetratricopeptide repeat protein n=1 Tax=Carboxylicivirga litoralis TaxID=2816963 RepID=UPI0021CB479F|nr:tetratricopeptide repeat protein [Carboxylicivirga sp. A043]MCU4156501.1 tetratricopeptide repeat protein [Carboxylicivirga sp. A043]